MKMTGIMCIMLLLLLLLFVSCEELLTVDTEPAKIIILNLPPAFFPADSTIYIETGRDRLDLGRKIHKPYGHGLVEEDGRAVVSLHWPTGVPATYLPRGEVYILSCIKEKVRVFRLTSFGFGNNLNGKQVTLNFETDFTLIP